MKEEIAAAIAKATPPVAVVSSQVVSSYTLDDWVKVVTIIYVVLQATALVVGGIRKWRAK